ncbi:hypothetical protein [Polaromonas sp. CF318]|uniref:hypothetical protein n=1 Tax=Polaromonas sp. CF318 TaxID=1144318 RepID=UPI00055CA7DF|nr:hypothetical protein [Polaromonas sp. CF318]
MSRHPHCIDDGRKRRDDDIFKLVGALAVIVGGMYYAWSFVGPSGQTMSVGDFFAFFFREILLAGFFCLALVVGCIVWLLKRAQSLFHRGGDAP